MREYKLNTFPSFDACDDKACLSLFWTSVAELQETAMLLVSCCSVKAVNWDVETSPLHKGLDSKLRQMSLTPRYQDVL